jgi:hypothetical protein
MPASDIGLAYGLTPIVRSLSKDSGFHTIPITDMSPEALLNCQCVIIPMMRNTALQKLCDNQKHLREYIQNGGNVFIFRSACGYKPHGWPLDTTIFPEICKGVSQKADSLGNADKKKITVIENGPITFNCKDGTYIYRDHYVLIKGNAGKIIVVDNQGQPVVVAGMLGKGKVVFDGLAPLSDKAGIKTMSKLEEEILLNSLKWFIVQ